MLAFSIFIHFCVSSLISRAHLGGDHSEFLVLAVSFPTSTALICSLSMAFSAMGNATDVATSFPVAGLLTCLFILAGLVAFAFLNRRQGVAQDWPMESVQLGLLMPLGLVLFGAILLFTNRPIEAWDALHYWAPVALELVGGAEGSFDIPDQKHPPLVAVILAAGGVAAGVFESGGLTRYLWFAPYAFICLFIFFSVRKRSTSLMAVICGFGAATTPLLENHMLLVGFAEIWIAAAVVGGVALGCEYCRSRRVVYLIMSVAYCSLPVVLKTTGIFYSISCLLPIFYFSFDKKFLRLFASLFLVVLCSVAWQLGRGELLQYQGRAVVHYGGRFMEFQPMPANDAILAFGHAFFVNSSFGVVGSLFIVVTAGLSFKLRDALTGPQRETLLCFLCVVANLFWLFAAVLFTFAGFTHALPGQDTGNSRFLIPAATLGWLLLGLLTAGIATQRVARIS